MPNPFALNQFTTKPLSFEEDLQLCQRLKIQQIELCQVKLGDEEPQQRNRLAALKDSGIRPCSVQATVHSVFPDRLAPEPTEPVKRLEAYLRCMELVAEYFPGEGLPFVAITGAVPGDDFRYGREVVRKSVRHLAEQAEQHGFRIAVEAVHPYFMQRDTFVYSLDDAQALVREADANNVGLVADIWHLWQETDIAERLRAASEQVLMVHVSDWPPGGPRALDDRLVPGDGCIPLVELLGALAQGGYSGAFCAELLSEKSLPGSLWNDPAESARRCRDGVDAIQKRIVAQLQS